MTGHETLRLHLHAYADNELDAGAALAFEAHLATCADCRAELAEVRELKQALRRIDLSEVAPPHLAARIRADLKPMPAWRSRMMRAAIPVLTGAIAATLVSVVFVSRPSPLMGDLVASHTRAVTTQHLVDIASNDRPVLKPWLIGKLGYSPPVLAVADGCQLIGGRLDTVGQTPTAALAYNCEGHTVSFYAQNVPGRAATTPPSVPRASKGKGYQVVSWHRGRLNCYAVSDMEPAKMIRFARFIETHAQQG